MLKNYLNKGMMEAGCDEAGRGCLAGPVYAAAVILPPDFRNKELNDSKQISPARREKMRLLIEREALAYSVASVEVEKIDEINILQASVLAMHNAVNSLSPTPEFLIIDGNYFHPYGNIPHSCIIKGDGKYLSVAAASILAKTCRDDHMSKLHREFPHYNWLKNKGYATFEHRKAIMENGICLHHRKSFNLNFQVRLEL
ncbi:MAG: ribonuclease HII [Bacteroidota bacterium]|nr:ribonuclease HII [Bacteroidota bacterium]